MHSAKPQLSLEDLSRVIEMAWEDRTPFDAIEKSFGLSESQVIALMRKSLKRTSFKIWRERVSGRATKHQALRSKLVCSGCHQSSGRGIKGVIPPLAGNPVVMAAEPNDIVKVMIRGIQRRDGYIAMPSFASRLSDQEILEISNYIRSSWGNGPDPNTSITLVEKIRANPGM